MTPLGPIECNRRVSVAMKCGLRSQIRVFGDDQHTGDLTAGCHNSNSAWISVPIPITDHQGYKL
jgi:hypothetical protein